MKIRLEEKYCVNQIYNARDNNPEYKKIYEEFKQALASKDSMKIDDVVVALETASSDIAYKDGFHAGMKFILDTMAGKEVIEV